MVFTVSGTTKALVQWCSQGRPGATHDQGQRGHQGTQTIPGEAQNNSGNDCRTRFVTVLDLEFRTIATFSTP